MRVIYITSGYNSKRYEKIMINYPVRESRCNLSLTILYENRDEKFTSIVTLFHCYYDCKHYDITLSWSVIEDVIRTVIRNQVLVHFIHVDNSYLLPGSIYLIMFPECCNVEMSTQITSNMDYFTNLDLYNYPGNNVGNITTTDLKLIKIMQKGYEPIVDVGSKLLFKLSGTSCAYFNWQVFTHLGKELTLEQNTSWWTQYWCRKTLNIQPMVQWASDL